MQLCLSIKCLFSLPLRKSLGMVHSLLQLAGFDWPVPDHSTMPSPAYLAGPDQLSSQQRPAASAGR
ncbi:transposase [Chromobacterium subtsugae]|uniref:Transposase n=1 Tax=Chromobacterium subtsugae TaxID=251747 RepID=A0ABS7FBW8_9NEIS|nr:transposase [Chromobacterium subtsugae]MBW8287568.1 transposase [Chromobacterium subtsugae]